MLKVGVFGVGHLGKFHLNNWREISDVELVGFYDPDDNNAAGVETKYNLKRFESFDKLLKIIALFNYLEVLLDSHIMLYQ